MQQSRCTTALFIFPARLPWTWWRRRWWSEWQLRRCGRRHGFPPVSVGGVRANDNNGGGVGSDPVSRVGDGASRGVGDDTCSRVGGGASDVVGEGVRIGATGGTCCSVSGRICGEVDDCIDWVCSGARTTS